MLNQFIRIAGPDRGLEIGGVKLLGFDANNAHKLVFTIVAIVVLYLISKALCWVAQKLGGSRQRTAFWTRQGISLMMFLLGVIGFVSIWFDNPSRLATGLGLLSAGLAFALQKVVTSFAGYFVILRGKTFNVGDRITMGGVRGDVISLNFIQTVIMEMGEPPAVQSDDPGMWVMSRQYSGRIVTISNAPIFEEPVYNYTREFPYIWEEMHIPISFKDDRHRAEQIILEAVERNTMDIANWAELSVRFLCGTHDIRGLKDRISREILSGLEASSIGIASGTYEIVGIPPIRLEGVTNVKRTPDAGRIS